jgi:hypothetical protein
VNYTYKRYTNGNTNDTPPTMDFSDNTAATPVGAGVDISNCDVCLCECGDVPIPCAAHSGAGAETPTDAPDVSFNPNATSWFPSFGETFSLCVPAYIRSHAVLADDIADVRGVFERLNVGEIRRVDAMHISMPPDDMYGPGAVCERKAVMFVHFKRWFNNEQSNKIRERLRSGKHFHVAFGDNVIRCVRYTKKMPVRD